MKCIVGFNHHGTRDALINKNITDKCDACGMKEDWQHILLCPMARMENNVFLNTLNEKINKISGIHEEWR